MNYRVVITPDAENDLKEIYRFIRSESPAEASLWIHAARKRAKSLSLHPERCRLAPEYESFSQPIRQLFIGSGNRGTYRVLFEIKHQTVYVLHVRHGSRLPLSPAEET
jgi:plasmid stabilization system protein ParE